jgi:hypothetical protein
VPTSIADLAQRLPLERKVAQLFLLGFEGQDLTAPIYEQMRLQDLGGLVFESRNYLDPQQVAALPHFLNNNGKAPATLLEAGTSVTDLASELERRGHAVAPIDLTSGLSIIAVGNGKLLGGADVRREGLAAGR